jgi:branched-chain amino acid transport system substrate-binding protein
MVERDDKADPKLGAQIADELIHKVKVVATVGIVNTGVGLSSIEKYQNAKVPLVIAVSTGTVLTKRYAPPAAPENYIFRVSPRTDIETAFLVNHIVDRVNLTKIAILADDTPYGESGKVDLEKALAARKLKAAAIERFKIGATDMSTQLARARAAGAEVVVMYGIGPELAAIAQSKSAMKWNAPLFAGWTASMQNFIDAAGKSGEGVMMPQTFIQDNDNFRRRSFVLSYFEQNGSGVIPSPMSAAQGYDAMRLLNNAMQLSPTLAGVDIKNALENMNNRVEGVITVYSRPYTPDDHDAVTSNMLVMGVVHNGKTDFAFKTDAKRSFMVERKKSL